MSTANRNGSRYVRESSGVVVVRSKPKTALHVGRELCDRSIGCDESQRKLRKNMSCTQEATVLLPTRGFLDEREREAVVQCLGFWAGQDARSREHMGGKRNAHICRALALLAPGLLA